MPTRKCAGRVLVVAGSREIPGAALLAGHCGAARRRRQAGDRHRRSPWPRPLALAVPEARVIALPETGQGAFATSTGWRCSKESAAGTDAALVGPGLMDAAGTCDFVEGLLPLLADVPVVLDALAMDVVRRRRPLAQPVLLTPHAGEMAHLSGHEQGSGAADPRAGGGRRRGEWQALVALKGVEHADRATRTRTLAPRRRPSGTRHLGLGRRAGRPDRRAGGPAGPAGAGLRLGRGGARAGRRGAGAAVRTDGLSGARTAGRNPGPDPRPAKAAAGSGRCGGAQGIDICTRCWSLARDADRLGGGQRLDVGPVQAADSRLRPRSVGSPSVGCSVSVNVSAARPAHRRRARDRPGPKCGRSRESAPPSARCAMPSGATSPGTPTTSLRTP